MKGWNYTVRLFLPRTRNPQWHMEIPQGAASELSPATQRGRQLSLLWWSGRIFESRPRAPMHFPDAGRPALISRDAKPEAHDKRGTGVRRW